MTRTKIFALSLLVLAFFFMGNCSVAVTPSVEAEVAEFWVDGFAWVIGVSVVLWFGLVISWAFSQDRRGRRGAYYEAGSKARELSIARARVAALEARGE